MASFFWLEPIKHSIEGIEFHLLEENHNLTASASSLPILAGTKSVIDNIVLDPLKIDVRFRVVNSQEHQENALRDMYQKLRDLYRLKKPVTLVLSYAVYPKALMTSLFMPLEASCEYADFQASFSINDFLKIDSQGNTTFEEMLIQDPLVMPVKNLGV